MAHSSETDSANAVLCRPWARLAALCLPIPCLLVLAGCPSPQEVVAPPVGLPFEGVTLKLLVVDDPSLAEAVRKLSGEWKAQTGAQLEVAECAGDKLLAARPTADTIVYPSHLLAELRGRDWVAPVPTDRMQGTSLAAAAEGIASRGIAETQTEAEGAEGRASPERWSDVFSALRSQEAAWGDDVYAVPLGSPVFTCYYRADLFQQFGKSPPKTWGDYQALCEFFRDRENLGAAAPPADRAWFAAAEPLADGWAGLTLLARAAAYAKHPYFRATLFDETTMAPRIDQPPFVRALEELVAAAAGQAAELRKLDPAGCRATFWRGECALALSWASAAGASSGDGGAAAGIDVDFAELPGAEQAYDPEDREWEHAVRGEQRHVTLLGVAGRLGSVVRDTPHHDAALQLLLSLSGAEWSERVLAASPATTLFRQQHVKKPRAWVEPQADAKAAARYAAVVSDSLGRADYVLALRLPGRERYLAALDQAVAAALSGEATAKESLSAAAERWQTITAELGVVQQRAAYEASLGKL